uniref:Uncharacterized protein n=1 Tax=Arundo donax TaxID=35708 RepID=A0A0A8ZGL9_ARUDO
MVASKCLQQFARWVVHALKFEVASMIHS